MNNLEFVNYIIIVIVAICVAISSFKKGEENRSLKEEAIKRGYAEMVLKTPTSDTTVFKWKE